MLDPIEVAIIDVTSRGDRVVVECEWQWGDREPREFHLLTGDWPTDADEVRAMVTAWVLDYAEEEFKLMPLRSKLMSDSWSITFDSETDPFGGAERAARQAWMEKSAGVIAPVPYADNEDDEAP